LILPHQAGNKDDFTGSTIGKDIPECADADE